MDRDLFDAFGGGREGVDPSQYSAMETKRQLPFPPQVIQETHMHPRSLDRRLQQIVRDGISLTLTDREELLPPLTVEL